MRDETRNILVVVDLDDADLVKGVQRYLLKRPRWRMSLCLIAFASSADRRRLMRLIRRIRPDGIVGMVLRETKSVLVGAQVPLVNVANDTKTRIPTVAFDDREMGRLAAAHLLEQGRTTLAYGGIGDGYYAGLRWKGFREEAAARGHACVNLNDLAGLSPKQSLSDGDIGRCLRRLPKPCGVFLCHAALAVRVVEACHDAALRVPHDVAVLAGTDRPLATTTIQPSLSAFHIPQEEVGYEAMQLLDGLMSGAKPPAAPHLVHPGKVIGRQSSDVLSTRDPEVAAALRLIRENTHLPFGVKQLLRSLPLCRRTLERRFAKVVGRSLHEEIMRCHLERAMLLLHHSNMSVSEVSSHSGFSTYASFVANFKEHTGMTPGAFRRTSLGEAQGSAS